MSNRKKFSSDQLVNEEQLNGAFDDAEDGDRKIAYDLGFVGVVYGLEATESTPSPNMFVVVSAGLAYSKQGGRIHVTSDQIVDMTIDELGAFTDPPIGQERWVAVFARQTRAESVPIGPDLNGDTIYFEQDESFDLVVVSGANAPLGTSSPPSLDADDVLIFEVLLVNGQSTIAQADINVDRAEIMISFTGVPGFDLDRVDPVAALLAMYGKIADIASGAGVLYTGPAVTWASAADVSGTSGVGNNTVNNYIAGIVGDLAAINASPDSGAARLGSGPIVVGAVSIAAGSALSQLTALASSANVNIPVGPTWADGTTNLEQSVGDRINHASTGMIARLATTAAGDGGAKHIGMDSSVGNFAGKSNVRAWLLALGQNTGATANGAYFVSLYGTGLGGGFAAVTDVYGGFARLARVNAGTDGASHIGTEAVGALAGATVRAQLSELDTGWGKLARTNTWTAKQTFDLAAPGIGLETGTNTTSEFNGGVTFTNGVGFTGTEEVTVGLNRDLILEGGGTGTLEVQRAANFSDPAVFSDTVALSGATTQNAAYTKSGTAATTAERNAAITNSAATATISVDADFWYVESPTAGTKDYTLKSTSPSPPTGAVIEFTAYGILIGATVNILREGAENIVAFAGASAVNSARFRFVSGRWKLVSAYGSSMTIGTPN